MKTGIEIIAEERHRQISKEGWTAEHDATHENGEMALAAATYALPESERRCGVCPHPVHWPWGLSWWKPTPEDRVRELAKAGALIAAEIDRLTRRRCM